MHIMKLKIRNVWTLKPVIFAARLGESLWDACLSWRNYLVAVEISMAWYIGCLLWEYRPSRCSSRLRDY